MAQRPRLQSGWGRWGAPGTPGRAACGSNGREAGRAPRRGWLRAGLRGGHLETLYPEVLGAQTTSGRGPGLTPLPADPSPRRPAGPGLAPPRCAGRKSSRGSRADIKPSHCRPGLSPSPGLNEAINPRAGWWEGQAPAHVPAAGQRPASLAGGDGAPQHPITHPPRPAAPTSAAAHPSRPVAFKSSPRPLCLVLR